MKFFKNIIIIYFTALILTSCVPFENNTGTGITQSETYSAINKNTIETLGSETEVKPDDTEDSTGEVDEVSTLENKEGNNNTETNQGDSTKQEVLDEEKYHLPFILKLDMDRYSITVCEKDEEGVYNRPINAFKIGIENKNAFCNNEYIMKSKVLWNKNNDNTHSQYVCKLSDSINIGSCSYEAQDVNTLIPESYNSIGSESGSMGISLTARDAKWIYDNCPIGTKLIISTENGLDFEPQAIPKLDREMYFTDPTDPLKYFADKDTYHIYIEKGSSSITVYKKGQDGQYSLPIYSFSAATGKTIGRTPVGNFELLKKERWHQFPYPFTDSYARYACYFNENLMIHSPVYGVKTIHAMVEELYNEIGQMKTAGCLRTFTKAAYWIYTYCDIGTEIEIVNGSPKGIKTVSLIPIDMKNRYTDPTDPYCNFTEDPYIHIQYRIPATAVVNCNDLGQIPAMDAPNQKGDIIGRILDGTKLTVTDEKNGWCCIDFNGTPAYIEKKHAEIKEGLFKPFSYRLYGYIEHGSNEETKDGVTKTRTDNLVDVSMLDSDIKINLLFAAEDNFTKIRLYDHSIAFLQQNTAQKLIKASELFKKDGYTIILYDAYRPYSIQQVLFDIIKNPAYIADPKNASHHNRGAAVDIGLLDQNGDLLEFPSPVDTFNETSHSDYKGMSETARKNLDYMISVMEECGFYNYYKEWWHFSDYNFDNYMVTDHKYEDVIMYN